MSDPKTSNPSQSDGGPTKGHSPVVRIVEWVVIGALGLVVANEAYSKFSYDATFAELEKAIDAAEATGDALASDEVAPLISGMPSRNEVVDGRKTLIDYQWRSLFKTYRIVVHTAPSPDDEMVVLSFETDAPPEEPQEEPQPAAVAGDGNSEPPSGPMMPGGGGSGGPPGMPGGPGQPGGAGRPELESEGDDQPEDSDNEPAESDEVSEETDETTDETVEAEETPEDSGDTTEETDPSA